MPPRLDQFAKGLGVGIHILENFVTCQPPGLQPAIELTNVCVPQRSQAIRSLRYLTFAIIVNDHRRILAR